MIVVVLLVLALAACGRQDPAPATPSPTPHTTFDDTARAFVELTIATDDQALKLLDRGAERATDPGLRALAGELAAVRHAELHELHTLLDAAGVAYVNHHAGHDMPGMPTEAELIGLASTDAEFDAQFVLLVRAHLTESAVVAKSAAKSVGHPETKAAAERMVEERAAALTRLG